MTTDFAMDRIVWSTSSTNMFSNNNNNNNNNNNHNDGTSARRRRNSLELIIMKNNKQHFMIDIVVAIVAIPTLICFALLLDKNMRFTNHETFEDRWIIFGLGFGFLIVSLCIGGYVTHRMGVCLWTGPLDDLSSSSSSSNGTNSRINSQLDILRMLEGMSPPAYEIACKMNYDIEAPPPAYESILISNEPLKLQKKTSVTEFFIISETSTYF